MFFSVFAVALPAEGVDRNKDCDKNAVLVAVALPAEGVDRNGKLESKVNGYEMSPSPRRAWIEISEIQRDPKAGRGRPPRGGRG